MDSKLTDYLMQLRERRRRQAEGYTPSTALADANDDAALVGLIGQSASKVGTLGGKEAGSNLGQFADRMARSNAAYQEQLNDSQARTDRGLTAEEGIAENIYKGAIQADRSAMESADQASKLVSAERISANKLAQEERERKERLGLEYARLNQDKELKKAQTAKEKAPTEGERTAAYHASRAQDAEDVLKQIEASGYDPADYGRSGRDLRIPGLDIRPFATSADRSYRQAQEEFIASILRKETGASVTPTEFEKYSAIYFPSPGDGPQNKNQKSVARIRAVENLKAVAGSAYDKTHRTPFKYTPEGEAGTAIAAPAGKTVTKKQFSPSRNQTKLIYSDGSEEIVNGRQ